MKFLSIADEIGGEIEMALSVRLSFRIHILELVG